MSQEDNTNIIAEGDWAKISSMLGANTANCMAPDCASSDASKDPMWSNTPTNTNEMAKLHWQPCRFPSARADRHGGQERCQASPPASSGKARSIMRANISREWMAEWLCLGQVPPEGASREERMLLGAEHRKLWLKPGAP